METNNTVVEALSRVPELVDAAKAIIEQNEKTNTIYAKALAHRAQAEIPDEEVQKVVHSVADVVHRTRCAAPDVKESGELIAQSVIESVQGTVEHAVRETIRNTPITLEHHHTHMTALGLIHMAEEKTRGLVKLVVVTLCVLIVGIGAAIYSYYQSDSYWARQYYEVANSKYATKSEGDMLWKDIYAWSILPMEFRTNSLVVKTKIKENKKILKQRRNEARNNKGKYSTSIPLQR